MSTIKVNKIENTSTTNGGVSIDNDGHVTVDGQQFPTAGPLSNRNLIINGAMTVSQRSTSNTGQTAGAYRACDRFYFEIVNLGTWTVEQSTDSPEGFANSFKATCTTADASPAANDNAFFMHRIEANNLQHLDFGSSTAKDLTLSFWVKSNKVGSFSVNVLQPDAGFDMVGYATQISAADTWEYKTITIPGDTTGQITNDNGNGLQLEWFLNSGSNWSSGSHPATWTALANANRNPSNLGVGGAVNDYFAITGVQLEVGSKATPFEHRSYSDELQRCERYFFRLDLGEATANTTHLNFCRFSVSSGGGLCYVQFPVTMRDNPTYTTSASGTFHSASGYVGVPTMDNSTTHGAQLRGASTQTTNSINYCRSDANGETAFFNFYAEL